MGLPSSWTERVTAELEVVGVGEVARINFEDDVEAQDEFWRLLELMNGDRDKALGKLLRFFRLAQKAFGYDVPMNEEDLRAKGFSDMIESGWAVPVGCGYQALGAAKHFQWYRQSVQRAIKGGEANKKRIEDTHQEESRPASKEVAVWLPPASPLSPSLAPSPVLALTNNTNTANKISSEDVKNCIFDWKKTLEHFGISRSLSARDETQIASAVQRFGAEWVTLAFLGARKQQKSKNWDPKQFVSLRSYLDPNRIERLVNIGAGKEDDSDIDWKQVFGKESA